jgi:ubiquinone/menaquinone biosynthesis C-methylase UbiE
MPQLKGSLQMPSEAAHEIVILDRKPPAAAIRRMVHEYFDRAAAAYDGFTESTVTRQRFVARMNGLIASDLSARGPVGTLLSIACGTGSRENDIRTRSGQRFTATGVDVSAAMCALARHAGLETIEAAWLEADLADRQFDAAVYLYSLGLVPTKEARLEELTKIARHLKPVAPFYVDVHNLDDRHEWGPELRRRFVEDQLGARGYDLGDTFYQRVGSGNPSFFHYFEQEEAETLLAEAGFRVVGRHYIDCGRSVGDLVGPEEGAILFVALRA